MQQSSSVILPRLLMLMSLLIFFSISCNRPISSPVIVGQEQADINPKNIILLIGDGMGLGQITGGMIANNMRTQLEKFPVVGLHKPFASDDLITDSAAGATAFACGIKTYNGAIGVNPAQQRVQTILEEAHQRGMVTGLVATSTIVHATPASFFAHNVSRQNYESIAADFLEGTVDIFIGGGKKYFDRRSDGRDLIKELKKKDYQIDDYFNADLEDIQIYKNKFGYLTADDSPLTVMQGRDYLEEASMTSIKFLDKRAEKGFFLMIESSQIDWGGHANNGEYIVEEFKDFDRVIGEILKWATKDKNTLVIVTADHETGGFSVNRGSTRDSLVTAFTSDYHTATLIPVFAYGPGSERFAGIYENSEIYHKMRDAYGWSRKMDLSKF